jgi:hypothetical protein
MNSSESASFTLQCKSYTFWQRKCHGKLIALLEQAYEIERRSQDRQKRFDPLIIYKMPIPQQLLWAS